MDIISGQEVRLNSFIWCGAVLNNFDLLYENTLHRCATFLRIFCKDSLRKRKIIYFSLNPNKFFGAKLNWKSLVEAYYFA